MKTRKGVPQRPGPCPTHTACCSLGSLSCPLSRAQENKTTTGTSPLTLLENSRDQPSALPSAVPPRARLQQGGLAGAGCSCRPVGGRGVLSPTLPTQGPLLSNPCPGREQRWAHGHARPVPGVPREGPQTQGARAAGLGRGDSKSWPCPLGLCEPVPVPSLRQAPRDDGCGRGLCDARSQQRVPVTPSRPPGGRCCARSWSPSGGPPSLPRKGPQAGSRGLSSSQTAPSRGASAPGPRHTVPRGLGRTW